MNIVPEREEFRVGVTEHQAILEEITQAVSEIDISQSWTRPSNSNKRKSPSASSATSSSFNLGAADASICESDDGLDASESDTYSSFSLVKSPASSHTSASRAEPPRTRPRREIEQPQEQQEEEVQVQQQQQHVQLNNPIVDPVLGIEDHGNCELCWESALITRNRASATNTNTNQIINNIQNLRELIFDYEKVLRGKHHDKYIFEALLDMRQTFIEAVYDKYDILYVSWTLEMIEVHYNVENGHIFDEVREHTKTLRIIDRAIKRLDTQGALYALDRHTGHIRPDRGIFQQLASFTKRREETVLKRKQAMESLQLEVTETERQMRSLLDEHKTQSIGSSSNRRQIESGPSQNVYDVGGL